MIYADPVQQHEFREGSKNYTRFCYAHGLLEDELGYDLLKMSTGHNDSELPEKDGVYTCEVKGYKGLCWAWIWSPSNSTRICVVVDFTDVEGMEFARINSMNKNMV